MIQVGVVLKVIDLVAGAFEVSADAILSSSRKLGVVKARHTVYKILHVLGNKKVHIAKSLDRNHTTVAHGLVEFDNLYNLDDDFRSKADLAMKQLIKTKYEEDTDTTEVRKG
jgi:chromosomal replication initiation ATPase DnaA